METSTVISTSTQDIVSLTSTTETTPTSTTVLTTTTTTPLTTTTATTIQLSTTTSTQPLTTVTTVTLPPVNVTRCPCGNPQCYTCTGTNKADCEDDQELLTCADYTDLCHTKSITDVQGNVISYEKSCSSFANCTSINSFSCSLVGSDYSCQSCADVSDDCTNLCNTCPNGTTEQCWTCSASSDSECQRTGKLTVCSSADQICYKSTTTNVEGTIIAVQQGCRTQATCTADMLVAPSGQCSCADAQCSTTRTCIQCTFDASRCVAPQTVCPVGQVQQCVFCSGTDQQNCLQNSFTSPCPTSDSVCFMTSVQNQRGTVVSYEQGCRPVTQCTSGMFDNPVCDSSLFNCTQCTSDPTTCSSPCPDDSVVWCPICTGTSLLECQQNAVSAPCPSNQHVCQTIQQTDLRGEVYSVSTQCVLASECTPAMYQTGPPQCTGSPCVYYSCERPAPTDCIPINKCTNGSVTQCDICNSDSLFVCAFSTDVEICPSSGSICMTSLKFDMRGQVINVTKNCALPSACTAEMYASPEGLCDGYLCTQCSYNDVKCVSPPPPPPPLPGPLCPCYANVSVPPQCLVCISTSGPCTSDQTTLMTCPSINDVCRRDWATDSRNGDIVYENSYCSSASKCTAFDVAVRSSLRDTFVYSLCNTTAVACGCADNCDQGVCRNSGICTPTPNVSPFYLCECRIGYGFIGQKCERLDRLYPFGFTYGDTLVPFTDRDDGYVQFALNDRLLFGATFYDSIFISVNGIASFGLPFLDSRAKAIPTARDIPVLAVFWADIDMKNPPATGNVFFSEHVRISPDASIDPLFGSDQLVFSMATYHIQTVVGDQDFVATNVIVITWQAVSPYKLTPTVSESEVACFQIVIISDASRFRSYVMYIYQSNTWISDRNHISSQGFQTLQSADDSIQLSLYTSLTPQANLLPTLTGNYGAGLDLGMYIFRTSIEAYELATVDPKHACQLFAINELSVYQLRLLLQFGSSLLPSCPPYYLIAAADLNFLVDPATGCATSVYSYAGYLMQCCYQLASDGTYAELLTTDGPASGGLTRTDDLDQYGVSWKTTCCLNSDNCAYYRQVRPVNRGEGYVNVQAASSFGDPHVLTLDLAAYSFSPIGEFWLIKHSNFSLQIRMVQAWKAIQQPVDGGSVFGGIVASVPGAATICAILTSDRTGIQLMIDGDQAYLDWFKNAKDGDVLRRPSVTISKQSSQLQVAFTTGVGFIASVTSWQMSVTALVTNAFKNSGMAGLYGNYNGDKTDDLTPRTGPAIPITSSEQDIYYQFGLSWRVTQSESLFCYALSENYRMFQNDSWVPYFTTSTSLPSNANQICGTNAQCLRDYGLTGNPAVAIATLSASNNALALAATLANNIPIVTASVNTVRATVGRAITTITLRVTDQDSGDTLTVYTLTQPAAIPGASFVRTSNSTYTFSWTPQSLDPVLLRFGANDSQGGVAPPVTVQVVLCNCGGFGTCSFSSPIAGYSLSNDSFVIVKCGSCNEFITGNFCNETLDPCALGICDVRFCYLNTTTFPYSYACGDCFPGYVKDGEKCQDIDECVLGTANCSDVSQRCVNTDGGFTCTCAAGYSSTKANGVGCTDINECALQIDGCKQICNNTPGSFLCNCSSGYVLSTDKKTCRPSGSNPCGTNTTFCSNGYCAIIDNTTVCLCPNGYQFNSSANDCTDINECASNTTNNCSPIANCSNTPGSYTCACPAGSTLQNDKRSCSDCPTGFFGIDCSRVCACAPNATCDRIKGCSKCFFGFTGPLCDVDINECLTPNVCVANSNCVNTNGSYTCDCIDWYTKGPSGNCAVLDACFYDRAISSPVGPSVRCNYPNGDCRSNLTVPGYFTCDCAPGYTGSRCETYINPCASSPCQNFGTCTPDNLIWGYTCSCRENFRGLNCEIDDTPISPRTTTTQPTTKAQVSVEQTITLSAAAGGIAAVAVFVAVVIFVSSLASSPAAPVVYRPVRGLLTSTSTPQLVGSSAFPIVGHAPRFSAVPGGSPWSRANPATSVGNAARMVPHAMGDIAIVDRPVPLHRSRLQPLPSSDLFQPGRLPALRAADGRPLRRTQFEERRHPWQVPSTAGIVRAVPNRSFGQSNMALGARIPTTGMMVGRRTHPWHLPTSGWSGRENLPGPVSANPGTRNPPLAVTKLRDEGGNQPWQLPSTSVQQRGLFWRSPAANNRLGAGLAGAIGNASRTPQWRLPSSSVDEDKLPQISPVRQQAWNLPSRITSSGSKNQWGQAMYTGQKQLWRTAATPFAIQQQQSSSDWPEVGNRPRSRDATSPQSIDWPGMRQAALPVSKNYMTPGNFQSRLFGGRPTNFVQPTTIPDQQTDADAGSRMQQVWPGLKRALPLRHNMVQGQFQSRLFSGQPTNFAAAANSAYQRADKPSTAAVGSPSQPTETQPVWPGMRQALPMRYNMAPGQFQSRLFGGRSTNFNPLASSTDQQLNAAGSQPQQMRQWLAARRMNV